MNKLPQIPLDLSPTPHYSFDSLILGDCNQDAVKSIKAWPHWPSPILLLIGPEGSGKTHIGEAWRVVSHETFIDDAEMVDEASLFSVFNSALNGDINGLLLASKKMPTDWTVELPDLNSRLLNTPIASLKEHDDQILEPILRKLFEDRGRAVSSDLVTYILKYYDRSVPALKRIAQELDLAAQSQKTDLTKAFAAKFLK